MFVAAASRQISVALAIAVEFATGTIRCLPQFLLDRGRPNASILFFSLLMATEGCCLIFCISFGDFLIAMPVIDWYAFGTKCPRPASFSKKYRNGALDTLGQKYRGRPSRYSNPDTLGSSINQKYHVKFGFSSHSYDHDTLG